MPIKIFQVSDVEWYAAETAEAAMNAYAMNSDYDIEEISQIRDEGYPVEIEDSELDTQTIIIDLDDVVDGVRGIPMRTVVTWRECLARLVAEFPNDFPCSFACEEY